MADDARPALWHAPIRWERVNQQDYGMHSYLYERWDHGAQLPSRLGNCTADSHKYTRVTFGVTQLFIS